MSNIAYFAQRNRERVEHRESHSSGAKNVTSCAFLSQITGATPPPPPLFLFFFSLPLFVFLLLVIVSLFLFLVFMKWILCFIEYFHRLGEQ